MTYASAQARPQGRRAGTACHYMKVRQGVKHASNSEVYLRNRHSGGDVQSADKVRYTKHVNDVMRASHDKRRTVGVNYKKLEYA